MQYINTIRHFHSEFGNVLVSYFAARSRHGWIKPPGGGTVYWRGWSGVAAELAELAIVNQVDQLIQVDDVTTPNRV